MTRAPSQVEGSRLWAEFRALLWSILVVVSAFFGFLHFSLERLRPQAPPPSEIIDIDKGQCEDSTEATSVEAKVELKADPIVVEAVIDQSGREANAQPGVIVDALCNEDTFVGPGISIGVNVGTCVGKKDKFVNIGGPAVINVGTSSDEGNSRGGPKKSCPHYASSVHKPYNYNLGITSKHKWYAVANGRTPRIYFTWEEAKRQVNKFSNANHKSFKSKLEAEYWMERELAIAAVGYMGVSPHRQNVEYLGVDDVGHDVFRCACCSEIFCGNGEL